MGRVCVICEKKFKKADKSQSFHIIPKQPDVRRIWIRAILHEYCRNFDTSSPYTYVCSDHFHHDDFMIKPSGLRYLKKDVCPTVPYPVPYTSNPNASTGHDTSKEHEETVQLKDDLSSAGSTTDTAITGSKSDSDEETCPPQKRFLCCYGMELNKKDIYNHEALMRDWHTIFQKKDEFVIRWGLVKASDSLVFIYSAPHTTAPHPRPQRNIHIKEDMAIELQVSGRLATFPLYGKATCFNDVYNALKQVPYFNICNGSEGNMDCPQIYYVKKPRSSSIRCDDCQLKHKKTHDISRKREMRLQKTGTKAAKNRKRNHPVKKEFDVNMNQLKMTTDMKEDLVEKLITGVPFDLVLDEIRDVINKSDKKNREHLLTDEDLSNIQNGYRLVDPQWSNDATNVDSWIEQDVQEQESCVLLQKLQGEVLDLYPELAADDYITILMNDAQAEILNTFGKDAVCLDRVFGTKKLNFITLSVLDDAKQTFPCAFFISNRCDEEVLRIYLNKIKQKVGNIESEVFMSDIYDSFYNAFKTIMLPPKNRLFCSWHVDRAWRANLNKIKSKAKQFEIYKILRTLMEEQKINRFCELLDEIRNTVFAEPDMKEFGDYFLKTFGSNECCWALCYQFNLGNTMERMHRTLEEICKNKTIDKILYTAQIFTRDRLYYPLTIRRRLSSSSTPIDERHNASLSADNDPILRLDGGWICSSSDSPSFFYIEKNNLPCDKSICNFRCDQCNDCIHSYRCTCPDNAIKWNMCRHVHLLCSIQVKPQMKRESEDDVPTEENAQENEYRLIRKKRYLAKRFDKLLHDADNDDMALYEEKIKQMEARKKLRISNTNKRSKSVENVELQETVNNASSKHYVENIQNNRMSNTQQNLFPNIILSASQNVDMQKNAFQNNVVLIHKPTDAAEDNPQLNLTKNISTNFVLTPLTPTSGICLLLPKVIPSNNT